MAVDFYCNLFMRNEGDETQTSFYSAFLGMDRDVDQPTNTSKEPFHVLNEPLTRSKTQTLNALVLKVSTKLDLKSSLEYK